MTVYASTDYATNAPVAVHGERKGLQVARFVVNTTAIVTTADTFNFGYMPANARLVGGYLAPSDLSAGADITINIGDAGSATRLFNASTAGQAGTYTAIPAAALDYLYTAKTLITGTIGVSATTTASGTIVLVMLYYVEE
jgi:hypothetical protein